MSSIPRATTKSKDQSKPLLITLYAQTCISGAKIFTAARVKRTPSYRLPKTDADAKMVFSMSERQHMVFQITDLACCVIRNTSIFFCKQRQLPLTSVIALNG